MTDKSCIGCIHDLGTDEEYDKFCIDCSRTEDTSCTCHISPPCGVCENDLYEEVEDVEDD